MVQGTKPRFTVCKTSASPAAVLIQFLICVPHLSVCWCSNYLVLRCLTVVLTHLLVAVTLGIGSV